MTAIASFRDTWDKTPAAAASRVVKVGNGIFSGFWACSTAGIPLDNFLMFFDAAALPPNGTVPILVRLYCDDGLNFRDRSAGFDLGEGIPFTAGLVWASSSTVATLTASAGVSYLVDTHYR